MRRSVRVLTMIVVCAAIAAAFVEAPLAGGAALRPRAAAPTAYSAQYFVRIVVHEQGSWDVRTQEPCSDRTASGTQLIDSDSAKTGNGQKPYAWMFTQKDGRLAINGFIERGVGLQMVQKATIEVGATQQTIDKACDEPVNVCNDCEASTPPTLQCGTRPGTLSIRAPFGAIGGADARVFAAPIVYEFTPPDPFGDESGRTFCPNFALSQWQTILAIEDGRELVIAKRKPLRYFSLNAEDQATCQRWANFDKDRCKANFTVKFKKIKTVSTPLPDYNVSRYESVLTFSFWFSGICTTTAGTQTCFDRLPNRWKRVPTLPGHPGY